MEKEEGEGRIGFYFFFLITLLHKGKKKISPSRNVRLWSRDASREKLEGSLERGRLVKLEIVKYELFIIYFFRLLQEKDIPRCNPFFRGNLVVRNKFGVLFYPREREKEREQETSKTRIFLQVRRPSSQIFTRYESKPRNNSKIP